MAVKRAPVLPWTAVALVVLLGVAGATAGWSEAGVRIVVRWTAKIAVVLFSAAFAASSLRTFWQSDATRWLMVNRRRLGLGFALAHFVHLLALVAIAVAFPHPFVDELNAVTIVGGGLAYGFVLLMAATSNDASVRRLGARRWRLLHTVGGWYVWIIFTQSYLGRAVEDPAYLPFAGLLFGVLGLRLARRIRERSAGRRAAVASGGPASRVPQ